MKTWTARCFAAVLISLPVIGCSAEEDPASPPSTNASTAGTAAAQGPPEPTDDDAGQEPGSEESEAQQQTEREESEPPEEEEPVSEASSDPQSIHVLVNKHNPLQPQDFEPGDLRVIDVPNEFGSPQMRQEAASALEELFAAAQQDGIDLWATTAYRDFHFQQTLYDQYFQEQGQEAADQISARPGYSEHQTGLAVDIGDLANRDCYLRGCFAESEQGRWLAENSHSFGFIIRYPQRAQPVTGYTYEPWHLRYVGEETAQDVHAQDVTLEEYWGQPAAPDYEHPFGQPPAGDSEAAALERQ